MAHETPTPPDAPEPDACETDATEQSIIACPKCAAPMERVEAAGVTIDRCRGCGGLWLDVLEKERLIKSKAGVPQTDTGDPKVGAKLNEQTELYCPRDSSAMIHMVDPAQPHVGFESCTVCGGVFLDAGELRDLADFTLIERLRSMFG